MCVNMYTCVCVCRLICAFAQLCIGEVIFKSLFVLLQFLLFSALCASAVRDYGTEDIFSNFC